MAFAGGLSRVGELPGFDYYDYNAFQFVFVLLQRLLDRGRLRLGLHAQAAPRRPQPLGRDRRYGVAALIRTLFVWVVVFAVALVTGLEIAGNGVDLAGLIGLALIVNVAAFLFAAGMMTRMRTLQAAPAMQLPVFFILMTAPVYVPRDLLQGWIEAVSEVNPATAILEAGRSLIAGDPFHLARAFAAATGLAALLTVWARGGLRRAEAAG
jgi:ABC-2 type transport system permease protein